MNPYDIHAWSIQYRQERMAEASNRSLKERAGEQPERRSVRGRLRLAWTGMLSLVGGAELYE